MAHRTREVTGVAPDAIPYAELLEQQAPVILKGVARDWPLVKAGLESAQAAMAYLGRFDSGRPVTGYTGAPEIGGRFHYDAAGTGMNFEAARVPLAAFLAQVEAHLGDKAGPSFYLGSTDLDTFLPGLRAENDLALNDPMFAANPVTVSLWAGNRTTASAHYDMSNNMAVCVAGHRRFTLFPPEQIANLYPGPLEPTPGGQVVSMVDFRDPDRALYPRFAEAEAAGQVAELEPGDMLFYPALWWHHVEALDDFNLLINYWWNTSPAFVDTPQNTLLHALLSLRDRPEAEKAAWKSVFDYYIFGPPDVPAAHLPEAARGNLAPLDEMKARRLRAVLLNKLNR
ncbi:MAG: cupin-like domain-containing protein [Sphingomonas sp.]